MPPLRTQKRWYRIAIGTFLSLVGGWWLAGKLRPGKTGKAEEQRVRRLTLGLYPYTLYPSMPFPFTFKLQVPGLSNPFSYPPLVPDPAAAGPSNVRSDLNRTDGVGQPQEELVFDSRNGDLSLNRNVGYRRASPSPLRSSRKRGWEPSSTEPYSTTRTTLESSNGYLDTPAKYREMAREQDGFQRVERNDAPHDTSSDGGQPPAKRRRGLAGSIVSTALSAALIGTAVGLTVYRLWRDRGKEPEKPQILITSSESTSSSVPSSPPPPPYSSSDPRSASGSGLTTPNVNVVPPTPRGRRARTHHAHAPSSVGRKRGTRVRAGGTHHKTHSISSFGPSGSGSGGSAPIFPAPQPAFDFSSSSYSRASQSPSRDFGGEIDAEADVDVEEQMDWIGGKLAMLIEEGKKALGKEVVVMSEAKEDEVDDGSGAWVDQEEGEKRRGSLSRSGSRKRMGVGSVGRRAGAGLGINLPPPYPYQAGEASGSGSLSASPRRSQFGLSASPSTSLVNVGLSSTPTRGEFSFEDERSWESPEVRESMEKARAKARERRMGGFS